MRSQQGSRRGRFGGWAGLDGDSNVITGAVRVVGCGGAERFSERIGTGSRQQQQVAVQGRPRRLGGQSAEQTLGALVEVGYHLLSGEVFGGDVEGVKVAGRGGAEANGGILLLTCTLRKVSPPTPCMAWSPARSRGHRGPNVVVGQGDGAAVSCLPHVRAEAQRQVRCVQIPIDKAVQLAQPDLAVAGSDVTEYPASADRGELLIITDQPNTATATNDELDGTVQGEGVGHPGPAVPMGEPGMLLNERQSVLDRSLMSLFDHSCHRRFSDRPQGRD
jgi:hypothetical protein